jgi:hypothetical protein
MNNKPNLTPEQKMKCSNFVIHSQRKRIARHQVCHNFRFIFKRISPAKKVVLLVRHLTPTRFGREGSLKNELDVRACVFRTLQKLRKTPIALGKLNTLSN